MTSRKTLLGLSVVLSLVFHGSLIALAPNVPLLRVYAPSRDLMRDFKVRVREDVPPEIEQPVEGPVNKLTTRPGSVTDLLKRDASENIEPGESALNQPANVPQLAERVAAEKIMREHELQVDEGKLKDVDARIVELSQDTLRQDIQVARRLVRPSPLRILGDEEFPVLRVAGADAPEELLAVDPLNVVAGPGGGDGSGGPEGLDVAARKEEILAEGPDKAPEESLPPLARTETIARKAEIANATREAKGKYEFLDDLVDIKLNTYVPEKNGEGFFKLSIVPKEGESIEVLPKDVTLVVDASNSILQRKLDNTVNGVKSIIESLRPDDRFNVVIFRDTPTSFRPTPVEASSDAKAAALDFVKDLKSRGETDVYRAVGPVVLEKAREGLPGIVVVVSDGRPTAGIVDGRTIINSLTAENENRNTIMAFGGGKTVNRQLLDLLAYRNKGEAYVAGRPEDINRELPGFFSRINDPILVDCQADYGRVDEETVFPKELPDFFKGHGVTVYGRFDPKNDERFVMRLKGRAGAKEKEIVFRTDLKEAGTGDASIASDWAFRKIYYLIGEICRVGEKPELLNELRELSRKYGHQTSYDY